MGRIEEAKLNKIIFCLNIRDHLGRVYYPEVMWTIFHSIAGMNDEKVLNCEQINNILKSVKQKYEMMMQSVLANQQQDNPDAPPRAAIYEADRAENDSNNNMEEGGVREIE